MTEFGKICNSHDDYIWRRVAGNVGTVARGGAAFSTYYVCDRAARTQADAIVKLVFAPIYDKMVADGKLKSWGWLEHIVGGQLPAPRHDERDRHEVADGGPCGHRRCRVTTTRSATTFYRHLRFDHTDYMWEIKASNP